jgi:hypothetical protein
MKTTLRFLATITVALILLGGAPVLGAKGVAVTLDAPAHVTENSTFTAKVDFSGAVDFDAGQFDVSYDESVVQLDNVTAGKIGTEPIPVAIWGMMDVNTCRVVVNVPGVPGVSGSGYLAVLSYRVVGAMGDSSVIELSNGFLNNNLAENMTATWSGASVQVRGPDESDNETSSMPMALIAVAIAVVVLACAGGLLWLRRCRARRT